jgi:hypothetical protein
MEAARDQGVLALVLVEHRHRWQHGGGLARLTHLEYRVGVHPIPHLHQWIHANSGDQRDVLTRLLGVVYQPE